MKVTLDRSKLLRNGAITVVEHDRPAALGRRETGMLGGRGVHGAELGTDWSGPNRGPSRS